MSIDISRPHIGRIYDYVLGGTYNHEADRRAADTMVERMPAYPRWARQNRAFLARVGMRWGAEGRARVFDLGSGLPTQGHFNTHMPQAKILFADIDPLSVAQGQQILAYTSDMGYVEADLRAPDALLEQAASFFGDDRKLAVGCIGIIYFLADAQIQALAERLHAFCAPGSVMALSWPTTPDTEEVRATIAAIAQQTKVVFYDRTPERVRELVKPWRMGEEQELVELFGNAPDVITNPDHPFHQTRMYGAFAEH